LSFSLFLVDSISDFTRVVLQAIEDDSLGSDTVVALFCKAVSVDVHLVAQGVQLVFERADAIRAFFSATILKLLHAIVTTLNLVLLVR